MNEFPIILIHIDLSFRHDIRHTPQITKLIFSLGALEAE